MATRGIVNNTQTLPLPPPPPTAGENQSATAKKRVRKSASDGDIKDQPPTKKAKKVAASEEGAKDQKPPRALLVMYKQVLAHPDYTTVIDKANPSIITHLASRYKNVDGVEVYESSRKHNRLLRCVWKFLHQKDPVLLEEAVALVTPKPAKAKKGGAVSLGSSGSDPLQEEDDDEEDDD